MGIIENIKETVKLVQQIDNIELYRKLLDLQAEAMELTEQLKEKDKTIDQLKALFEIKGNLLCKDSAYYIVNERKEIEDGPFCTKCFDVDRIKCRLVANTAHPEVKCQKCNIVFDSRPTYEYLVKNGDSRKPQCYVL